MRIRDLSFFFVLFAVAACGEAQTEPTTNDPCDEAAYWELRLDWTGGDCEEADLPRTDDFYVKQIVGGGIFVERPGEMQTLTMTSEAIGPYCRLQVTHERLDGWTMIFDLTTSDNGGVSGRVQVEGVNCTGEGTVIGTRSP